MDLKADKSIEEHAQKELRLQLAGWPSALIKSASDSFEYALGMRSGLVVLFTSATPSEDLRWVCLNPADSTMGVRLQIIGLPPEFYDPDTDTFGFGRGLEIRVADIVWCADGGHL